MSKESISLTLYADQVREFITTNDLLSEWPDYRRVLLKSMSTEQLWFLALPVVSCLAVGGTLSNGLPVAAGWYIINQAAHVLDSVQDGNFVSDGTIKTAGEAINLATSLIFVTYHFLGTVQKNVELVTRVFSEAGFKSTLGQNQFLAREQHAQSVDEALNSYWRATILKSGSLFRMATAGGAAAGTDNPYLIKSLGDYGTALGVILQILDDCRDVLDAQTGDCEISLPVLLYSLARGEKEIVRPESRAQLVEAGVPEMVSSTLSNWWQRALDSLASLEANEAVDSLRCFLPDILKISPQEIFSCMTPAVITLA